MVKSSARVKYLDGLRGIACLMVVVQHYSISFQPSQPNTIYDDGTLAVALFFLMSGFVLTESFSQIQYRVSGLLAARLFRLLTPTIIAICSASFLYRFSQPVARTAYLISGSPWSGNFINAPSLMQLPGDLLASVFGFSNTALFRLSSFISSSASSDGPLWTISYEIYGSIVTLILTRIYHIRRPWWYLAVTVFVCGFGFRELGLFVIGHIARVIWKSDQAEKFNAVALLIGLSAVAASVATHLDLYRDRPVLEVAVSGIFPHWSPLDAAHAMVGILVFSIVIYSRTLQRILSLRQFLYLGRLSFSIYLIHWPIMVGFGSSLYLLIGSRSDAASWTVFLAGAVITGVIAVAFERYVDAPAITLSRRIREYGISNNTVNPDRTRRQRPAAHQKPERVID